MPYRANYPAAVAEVLQPGRKYKPAVLRALKAFRRDKAWRGTRLDRYAKICTLHNALCLIYDQQVSVQLAPWQGVNWDCYIPHRRAIVLTNCSVVTYLHEFGHVLGKDERQTCRWSINLFARIFPRSFARCRFVGHTLRRDDQLREGGEVGSASGAPDSGSSKLPSSLSAKVSAVSKVCPSKCQGRVHVSH